MPEQERKIDTDISAKFLARIMDAGKQDGRDRKLSNELISERLEKLFNSSSPEIFKPKIGDSYAKFLHPHSYNVAYDDVKVGDKDRVFGFYLNDLSVYQDLVKELQASADVPLAIQKVIDAYYGALDRPAELPEKRKWADDLTSRRFAFYSEFRSKKGVPGQKELKKKNVAMCAERASLAHNLNTFLGYESSLEWNYSGENGELHVFEIIKLPDGSIVLYDPTKPLITYDGAGKIVSHAPFKTKISSSDLAHLRNGQGLEVEHCDYEIKSGKTVPVRCKKIKYGIKSKS